MSVTVSERRLLAFAIASQASISIVQWGLGALAPDLADRYHLSQAALGLLINATAFGNAFALIPAGGLVDRIGPRRPLLLAGTASGLLVAVAGLAGSALVLGIAFVIAGMLGALVAVAATISVFHGFPPERRGFAIGMRQMSVSLGGLIAAFLLPALAGLSGVPLALAASGLATAACAFAFGRSCPPGPLVPVESRRALVPMDAMRVPGMWALFATGLALIWPLTAVLTFSVQAIRDGGGSRLAASLAFALISLSAMAARVIWGRIADSGDGTRRVDTLRDVALLTVCLSLVTALVWPYGTPVRVIAVVVLAFGALGFNGVLYVVAGELAGPARAGQAVGWMSTALFGGGAIAAAPLGALIDGYGYRVLWLAAAVAGAVGVLLARTLYKAYDPVLKPT